MNILSKRLDRTSNSNDLVGVKIARHALEIFHLFFADDALFFSQASEQECLQLFQVIQEFCEASGKVISKEKSSIIFSPSTPDNIRDTICTQFGILEKESLGLYLATPTDFSKPKKSNF